MFDFLDSVSHPLPCFRQTLLISSFSESGDPRVTLSLQTNPIVAQGQGLAFSGVSHEMSSHRFPKLVLRSTGSMAPFLQGHDRHMLAHDMPQGVIKPPTHYLDKQGKPAGLRPTTTHSYDVSLQTLALRRILALFLPKSAIVPTAHGTASETSLTCLHQPDLWIGTLAKVALDHRFAVLCVRFTFEAEPIPASINVTDVAPI